MPGQTHHVFFINAGKCEIVKKVGFVRCVSPYLRPELILQGSKSDKADPQKFLNKPYGRRLRRLTPEDHYLTVLTLTAGDYFGVGKCRHNLAKLYHFKSRVSRLVLIYVTSFFFRGRSH